MLTLVFFFGAAFAPLVAPYNPFDLASIDIMDASLPPFWQEGGDARFWLGTDDQGRDMWSTIIFGARVSLLNADVTEGTTGADLDASVVNVVAKASGLSLVSWLILAALALLTAEWWIYRRGLMP